MAELAFDCLDVTPQRYAAAPTLLFRLRVAETTGTPVHAMVLRCQIRIEAGQRRYSAEESELLAYLFGAERGRTARAFQFATVPVMVGGFTGSTEVEVPVACSYDLEVAAGKYFHSVRDGVVPLVLLFSGTVFGRGDDGLWVEQVPWRHEATYRLPVATWQELMDIYFPGSAWLRLHRGTVDALQRYKTAHAIPTWDAALESLLSAADAPVGDGASERTS